VLLIVKNYTGDRLNFGLAAELARAAEIPVETVIVADDVALAKSSDTAGRRGLAGTVLVHKIAGASAAQGNRLEQVAQDARDAAAALATMSLSLSMGTLPGAAEPNFVLGDTDVELGLGIHGEPGVERIPLAPADGLVERLLDPIFDALPLAAGARVVLLINNLGALTAMEMAIVARHALAVLEDRGIIVERVYSGALLTSLETAGVSLSILLVDDGRLALLDAPTEAPAWPRVAPRRPLPEKQRTQFFTAASPVPATDGAEPATPAGKALKNAVIAAADALLASERMLTEIDGKVGDGDLGASLARGAARLRSALKEIRPDDPAQALRALGVAFQDVVGGTSGPLYGVFLLRAASQLEAKPLSSPQTWAHAFAAGVVAISELGGARQGDRTMLDALIPFSKEFGAALEEGAPLVTVLRRAAEAAEEGAQATAQMVARRGRSSYLGSRSLGVPDPGAIAAAIWLRAVVETLRS
jgi:dihydroxyacetone kinase